MKSWKGYLSFLLVFLLLITLVGCNSTEEAASKEEDVSKELTSGSYEAEGNGFGGKMNVKVTIDEGKIEGVEVVDNYETAGVGKVALDLITDRIVLGQSTEVEAVAGATISSKALMSTVRKALDEAGATKDQFAEAYKVQHDIKSEREADVVIIGGGGTGLAAAVTAGQENASVIVLETNGIAGGNLVVSGGVYNSPDPELQKEQGIEDSTELFMEQTLKGEIVGNPDLVKVITGKALDGLNWLRDIGVVL